MFFVFLYTETLMRVYIKEELHEETSVEEDYKHAADRLHAGGRSAGDADVAGRGI